MALTAPCLTAFTAICLMALRVPAVDDPSYSRSHLIVSTAEGGGAPGEAGEAAVDYDFGALNVGRVIAREE